MLERIAQAHQVELAFQPQPHQDRPAAGQSAERVDLGQFHELSPEMIGLQEVLEGAVQLAVQ